MLSVFHIITGLEAGGAERVLYCLIKDDRDKEHIVVSFTDEGYYGPLLKDLGIKVITLHLNNVFKVIAGIFRLLSLIKSHKPDIFVTWMIHASLLGGLVAKLSSNSPIIWNFRGTIFTPGGGKELFYNFLLKVCSLLSDKIPSKIICCAESISEELVDIKFPNSKITVIPNGYDLNIFKPRPDYRKEVRSNLGISENLLFLGMFARWDPQKNIDELVHALSLMKKKGQRFKMLLAGSGINNEKLTALINICDLKNEVILLDQSPNVEKIMNSLDIHILSSSYGEGFPNVICETMACGIPNVSTNVGDSSFIIQENGWIASDTSRFGLADAISNAIKDYENNEVFLEKKHNSEKRIKEKFTLEKMISSYTMVIESCLEEITQSKSRHD